MKNLMQNLKNNEIEELALRFANKFPNETNFNNNKSKRYFESKQNTNSKGTLSSNDTIRMSYKSCRRSKCSIINSDKSYCKLLIFIILGVNTSSKNGTLRTENDREISNIQNFYIVSYDRTSTKKDAFKVEQKTITDDVYLKNDDLNILEEEIIVFEEKIEEKKIFSNKNLNSYNSSISTQNESVKLSQKFEYLMQIDMFYSNFFKQIEAKKYDFDQLIENWFNLTNNNNDIIYQEVIKTIINYSLYSRTSLF